MLSSITLSVLSLGILLSSCTDNLGFMEQDSSLSNASIELTGTEQEEGVIVTQFSAASDAIQMLTASANSEIKDASIAIPPGALALDTQITIEKGATLASVSALESLGLSDNSFQQTAPAVMITSSLAIDTAVPMSVSVPLPSSASLNLADNYENLVILFKAVKAAENGAVFQGIIPREKLSIENGKVIFETNYFGSYQAVVLEKKVEAPIEVKNEAPIISAREEKKLPQPIWDAVQISFDSTKRELSMSSKVSGLESIKGCAATLDDDKVAPWQHFKPIGPIQTYKFPVPFTEKKMVYARFECVDNYDRVVFSEWGRFEVPAIQSNTAPEPDTIYTDGWIPGSSTTNTEQSITYVISPPGNQTLRWFYSDRISANILPIGCTLPIPCGAEFRYKSLSSSSTYSNWIKIQKLPFDLTPLVKHLQQGEFEAEIRAIANGKFDSSPLRFNFYVEELKPYIGIGTDPIFMVVNEMKDRPFNVQNNFNNLICTAVQVVAANPSLFSSPPSIIISGNQCLVKLQAGGIEGDSDITLSIPGDPDSQITFQVNVSAISPIPDEFVDQFSDELEKGVKFKIFGQGSPSSYCLPVRFSVEILDENLDIITTDNLIEYFSFISSSEECTMNIQRYPTRFPGVRIIRINYANNEFETSTSFKYTVHQEILRSIGFNETAPVANGSSAIQHIENSTFTISEGTGISFIGPGDVIKYNGGVAFVAKKLDSSHFLLTQLDGSLYPSGTIELSGIWNVYRAYNSLKKMFAGTVNGTNDSTPYYDSYYDSVYKNLIAYNAVWKGVVYKSTLPEDFTNFDIPDNWITGPKNFIHIYAPYKSNEVANPQRHEGYFQDPTNGPYTIYAQGNYGIDVKNQYIGFTGLQFKAPDGGTAAARQDILRQSGDGMLVAESSIFYGYSNSINAINKMAFGELRVDNNIIHGASSGSDLVGVNVNNWQKVAIRNNTFARVTRAIIGPNVILDPLPQLSIFNNLSAGCALDNSNPPQERCYQANFFGNIGFVNNQNVEKSSALISNLFQNASNNIFLLISNSETSTLSNGLNLSNFHIDRTDILGCQRPLISGFPPPAWFIGAQQSPGSISICY